MVNNNQSKFGKVFKSEKADQLKKAMLSEFVVMMKQSVFSYNQWSEIKDRVFKCDSEWV